MKVKVARVSNNFSLFDVVYQQNIKKFTINVVEFGQDKKGSKNKAQFFISIDEMSMLADDIVNNRYKGNWKDNNKFRLFGGKSTAREMNLSVYRDKNEKIKFAIQLKNGEASQNSKGGTTFKPGAKIDQAASIQDLYHVRTAFKSVLDFINKIPMENRWEIENPGEDYNRTYSDPYPPNSDLDIDISGDDLPF